MILGQLTNVTMDVADVPQRTNDMRCQGFIRREVGLGLMYNSPGEPIVDQIQALGIGGVEDDVPRFDVAVDEFVCVYVFEGRDLAQGQYEPTNGLEMAHATYHLISNH